jgi:hypothetical protein
MTTFDGVRVKYFDLHEDFGFASIVEMDETVALDLNGAVIRSWPKGDQPEISRTSRRRAGGNSRRPLHCGAPTF